MIKGRWLLLGAVLTALVHSAALWWMVESRASILRDGEEVVLKTVPVDPRDLLRGKFIRLNYEVSTIEARLFEDLDAFRQGEVEPCFVHLRERQDGRAEVIRVTKHYPTTKEPGVSILRGELRLSGKPDALQDNDPIRVNYAIDRFYVPEGDAIRIEEEYRDTSIPVDIVIAIGEEGTAQIKRLLIDGIARYEEPLY